MAESSSLSVERERAFFFATRETRLLYQIEQALQRIELGEYGLCVECGKPIQRARLQSIPYVSLCIDCKTNETNLTDPNWIGLTRMRQCTSPKRQNRLKIWLEKTGCPSSPRIVEYSKSVFHWWAGFECPKDRQLDPTNKKLVRYINHGKRVLFPIDELRRFMNNLSDNSGKKVVDFCSDRFYIIFYSQVLDSSGKQARKAGKLVWDIDTYVRNLKWVFEQKIGFYRRNQKAIVKKLWISNSSALKDSTHILFIIKGP